METDVHTRMHTLTIRISPPDMTAPSTKGIELSSLTHPCHMHKQINKMNYFKS